MDLEVRPLDAGPVQCALCRDALVEPTAACSACGLRVHAACSRELGRCPTLGCAGGWGARAATPARPARPAVVAASPPRRRRPRARLVAAALGALVVGAWGSTFRAPVDAERVLGGWFSGHGSLAAAVVATFGPAAPRGVGGAPVEAVAFTPDGRRLITAALGEVIAWDVETGAAVARGRVDGPWSTPWLAVSPDGQQLLVPAGLFAELWDVASMERVGRLSRIDPDMVERPSDDEPWRAVRLVAGAFTARGPILAFARPGEVALRDLGGERLGRLKTAGPRISRVAFAPGGARLAVTSSGPTWSDERREVWDLDQGSRAPRASLWSDVTAPMAFSPDGLGIVWHDVSGTHVWAVDAARARVAVEQTGIGYGVDAPVALSPDGGRAAVASFHGVEVHDLVGGRVAARYRGHGGRRVAVRAVAWSPDGRWIATGGDDQRVIVWRAP